MENEVNSNVVTETAVETPVVQPVAETPVVPQAEVTQPVVVETPVAPAKKVGRPKTKVTLKRVVLLNGAPVGRGRPSKEGKGERTVVFIPVGETFDATKHGVGVQFKAGRDCFRSSIKRVDIKKFAKMAVTPVAP